MRDTFVYKYWGVTGLKWFGYLWFAFTNVLLSAVVVTILAVAFFCPATVHPLLTTTTLAAGAFAFGLLERMRRNHWFGVFEIETDVQSTPLAGN